VKKTGALFVAALHGRGPQVSGSEAAGFETMKQQEQRGLHSSLARLQGEPEGRVGASCARAAAARG